MTVLSPSHILRGVPASDTHKPDPVELARFLEFVNTVLLSGTLGNHVYETLADATTAAASLADGVAILVYDDATAANNGLYTVKSAAPVQLSDQLPGQQIIFASDDGNSTGTAYTLDTSPKIANGSQLVIFTTPVTNTGTVTVSFDGGAAKTIITSAGAPVVTGGLLEGGLVIGVVSGSNFVIYLGGDASAFATAAQNAQAATEVARDQALAAVPQLIFESVDDLAAFASPTSATVAMTKRYADGLLASTMLWELKVGDTVTPAQKARIIVDGLNRRWAALSDKRFYDISDFGAEPGQDIGPVLQDIIDLINATGVVGGTGAAHIIRFDTNSYPWNTAVSPILKDNVKFDLNGASIDFGSGNFTALQVGDNGTNVEGFQFVGHGTIRCSGTPGPLMKVIDLQHVADYFIDNITLDKAPTQFFDGVAASGKITARGFINRIRGGVYNQAGVVFDLGSVTGGSFTGLILDKINVYVEGVDYPGEAPKTVSGVALTNPCRLTVSGHGWTTGREIYVRDVGGTTQLNGNSYTITVIDANTVSLDGVDGTGFTAFSGDGKAFLKHQAATNCRAFRIQGGVCDTIVGGEIITNRFDRSLDIQAVTPGNIVGNIYFDKFYGDYSKNGARIAAFGGNINRIRIGKCWLNASDGKALECLQSGGLLAGIHMEQLDVLMSGTDGITLASAARDCTFNRVKNYGTGRLANAASVAFDAAAGVTNINVTGYEQVDPTSYYGASGTHLPNIGIRFQGVNDIYSVVDCITRHRAGGAGYALSTAATTGGRKRLIKGNRRFDNAGVAQLPEYLGTVSLGTITSPFTWVNNTGLPVQVHLRNGSSATTLLAATVTIDGNTMATAVPCDVTVCSGQTLGVTFASGTVVGAARTMD